MRLYSALLWFWHMHDRHAEGAQWGNRLLEAEAGVRGGQPLRTGAQPLSWLLAWSRCASVMAFMTHFRDNVGPIKQLLALTAENIRLCRAIGEPASYELAWALRVRAGDLLHGRPEAIVDFQENLAICRRHGYRALEAETLLNRALSIPDFLQRVGLLEAGLAIGRELGDPDSIASHLGNLALSSHFSGDYERAKRDMVECLDIFKKENNLTSYSLFSVLWFYIDPQPESARQAYRGLDFFRQHGAETNILYFSICAHTEWSLGNAGPAEALALEALAIARRAKINYDQVFPLTVLARIALDQGALAQAAQHLREARGVAQEADIVDGWLWVLLLDTLALYLLAAGKPADAAQVFGGLDGLYQYILPGSAPRLRSEHAAALSALRGALDEAAFTQAWQSGQALTLWQAYQAGMEGV